MTKLSVVLATKNEEANILACLEAIKSIADEIVIFDEHSTDKTVTIAKSYGARVHIVDHEPIFHITKQKAIDAATGDWILQLDADEIVSDSLASEIKAVISMSSEEILKRRPENKRSWKLFKRHQKAVEARDHSTVGNKGGEVVAFFIPRRNLFIGKALTYAGVYPDGAIRLIKKGKAYLPAKSVHELMVVDGQVSWLFSDLTHNDSPTLEKYIMRLNRYTDLDAKEFSIKKLDKSYFNVLKYSSIVFVWQFLWRYLRRRGYKDGLRGFLWALFSAWQYPLAYYKYYLDELS